MGLTVNKRALSETLGISEASLTAWQKEGMPVVEFADMRGESNAYDTEAVIRWWIEREVARRSDKSTFDHLNEIRAKREGLAYRREIGAIIFTKDIRPAFERYGKEVTPALLCMPDKYAQVLDLAQGVDGKHQVLQDLVAEIRDVLGRYQFGVSNDER